MNPSLSPENKFFFVDRPAGEYTVLTFSEVERTVSFVLEEGQTRYIRFKVSIGFFAGHVYGELVDEGTALEEMKNCLYNIGDLEGKKKEKEAFLGPKVQYN